MQGMTGTQTQMGRKKKYSFECCTGVCTPIVKGQWHPIKKMERNEKKKAKPFSLPEQCMF